MPGPDSALAMMIPQFLGALIFTPLAYVGMGPGPEFIPYFLALLGLIGAAFMAMVQWPIVIALRWLKRKRGGRSAVETQAEEGAPAPRDVSGEQTQYSAVDERTLN